MGKARDKKYPEKLPKPFSGKEAAKEFQDMLQKYRRHHFNIKTQQAVMDAMRKDIPPGTVVIHVDFSENYENKQQNEIQSAYFGHENFALYTACAWFSNSHGATESKSFVVVTNESDHSKHGKVVALVTAFF